MWYNTSHKHGEELTKGVKTKMATSTTKVNSTLIRSVGYDADSSRMEVTFNATPSTVWQYAGVSQDTYNQFVDASSKGQFFNGNIRGRFPTTKVSV